MKVLLITHASLFPPEHGGAKNIHHVGKSLQQKGYEVSFLVKMHPDAPERIRFAGQFLTDLESHQKEFSHYSHSQQLTRWTADGISYKGIHGDASALCKAATNSIELENPVAIFLCDDTLDESAELFELVANTGRLHFLAQTIHSLPFGPHAMKPSTRLTNAIQRAKTISAPSEFVQRYVEKELSREVRLLYPNVFGVGPFPKLGSFRNRYVTFINPCPWKGSSIFLDLAKNRPDISFAVVPTWGATPDVMEKISDLENVTVLTETSAIEEIYAQTKVLLAPSICQEAFGLVSPEALLRGIPVVASDIAGLRESTLGSAQLIPVVAMPAQPPKVGNDHTKFQWIEPKNDWRPWSLALDSLLDDEEHYQEISISGKKRAEDFVQRLARRDLSACFDL